MRTFHDQRGLAGTVLIVVIAWALAAVLMLTGTLISAQQIDDRVATITGEVGDIDLDTDDVALVEETNRIAADILDAAKPLSGQLDQVIASAKSIDGTVVDILDVAGQINTTVKDINGTATGIGSTVNSIHSSVSGILGFVRQIEAGVTAINVKADTGLGIVSGIRSDLANVLTQVGPGHRGPGGFSIHGHANNINCKVPTAATGCGD